MERRAVIVLLVLIIFLTFLPDFLPVKNAEPVIEDSLLSELIKEWDVQEATGSGSRHTPGYQSNNSNRPIKEDGSVPRPIYFPFDPNKIGLAEWLKLGVKRKTAESILLYREKGGHFKKAEDLKKIYNLPASTASALIPFVKLDEMNKSFNYSSSTNSLANSYTRPRDSSLIRKNRSQKIFINAADSLDWLSLPGIGPKLASRILLFREKLGGFYNTQQVAEVFGLPDSVYRQILPLLNLDSDGLKQIDINEADQSTLAAHPYIRWKIAAAIIEFRKSHGSFQTVDELLKIHLISDDQFKKVAPYCKIR